VTPKRKTRLFPVEKFREKNREYDSHLLADCLLERRTHESRDRRGDEAPDLILRRENTEAVRSDTQRPTRQSQGQLTGAHFTQLHLALERRGPHSSRRRARQLESLHGGPEIRFARHRRHYSRQLHSFHPYAHIRHML